MLQYFRFTDSQATFRSIHQISPFCTTRKIFAFPSLVRKFVLVIFYSVLGFPLSWSYPWEVTIITRGSWTWGAANELIYKSLTGKLWFYFYICDIVIYNMKYIFGLDLFPETELLKPLEFPSIKTIKVSFLMLKRWFLERS